jgi:hypothetical protein
LVRGEKAPWHISTAVANIVRDETGGGIT